ncbi:MAG TPA: ribonuclease E activity regulator RraA [Symbiobacteriaceae bacterium]
MLFRTSDLCDLYPNEVQVAEPILTSFGARRRFHGPVATVRVYEDNVLVKEALETVPSGTVLVVDGGASRRCALLGDQLAAIGVERGIAGVIINGCVRDAAELASMGLGVLALGTCPRKSKKEGRGERQVPVEFAGVRWEPGAYVYVDEDGVVVSPRPLMAYA